MTNAAAVSPEGGAVVVSDTGQSDINDLIICNACACFIMSLYCKIPDCLCGSYMNSTCLCCVTDASCCKVSKADGECCLCCSQTQKCITPTTCAKCINQVFCLDIRGALPCDKDVPCIIASGGIVCCYNYACKLAFCTTLKGLKGGN